ncbi:MAG TPA: hypothetical protein VEO54_21860 [Thermoanaerobaculia bacterium]|nr:hypothetical protein [Thermoanaerobaculia bacterium]
MKKAKKSKIPSGRTTTPVPPAANREPRQPAANAATATEAPVSSSADFKAGKDL